MPRTPKNDVKQIVLSQEQYDGLITRLDSLSDGQNAIKLDLAGRKHIDEEVEKHKELLTGNGKPGFVAIRDKVLSWDAKVSAITLLILGDVVVRIVSFAMTKP